MTDVNVCSNYWNNYGTGISPLKKPI